MPRVHVPAYVRTSKKGKKTVVKPYSYWRNSKKGKYKVTQDDRVVEQYFEDNYDSIYDIWAIKDVFERLGTGQDPDDYEAIYVKYEGVEKYDEEGEIIDVEDWIDEVYGKRYDDGKIIKVYETGDV